MIHDPGIAGLDRALRRAAWARTPLVGGILSSFIGGERNDGSHEFIGP